MPGPISTSIAYWKEVARDAKNAAWIFMHKGLGLFAGAILAALVILLAKQLGWNDLDWWQYIMLWLLCFIALLLWCLFLFFLHVPARRHKELDDKLKEIYSQSNILLDLAPEDKKGTMERWISPRICNNTASDIEGCAVFLDAVFNRQGDPLEYKLPRQLAWSGDEKRRRLTIDAGGKQIVDLAHTDKHNNKAAFSTMEMGEAYDFDPGTYFVELRIGGKLESDPLRNCIYKVRLVYAGDDDLTGRIIGRVTQDEYEREREQAEERG